ncbi:ThuA domain-containing protein [Terrarubrum flagellatum]|uniref:ThuA domain-containing protein n=1 Tax=Terrirubrum flagellatum TaxID=2895980 RepID=UPI0031455269
MADAIDVRLIAGGKYHDIDYARLQLLALLSEHERARVRIAEDYGEADELASADMLVTYTCDVVPSQEQIEGLKAFLSRGRRWFALHGTNSTFAIETDGKVKVPPLPRDFYEMLGSQFMAHPPIGRYRVRNAQPSHPLVSGVGDFLVEDEHYLQEYLPGNEVLLTTRFSGSTSLFEKDSWPEQEHQAMYLRKAHGGEILYLTLGHARGRYDMRPIADFYPAVERGAWQLPVFHELLRRGIRWALEKL